MLEADDRGITGASSLAIPTLAPLHTRRSVYRANSPSGGHQGGCENVANFTTVGANGVNKMSRT